MSKIAIMQPYFLPYIGYWQLINTVDAFIILDDVNFIKKGFINRNYIKLNKEKHLFTLPIKNLSQNTLIKDSKLNFSDKAKNDFITTLRYAYKTAPYYDEIIELLHNVVFFHNTNIVSYIHNSLLLTSQYLSINTPFYLSSELEQNPEFRGQEKIINLCKLFSAKTYINPINGKSIYSKELFQQNNIDLFFLRAKEISYPQGKSDFIPFLSIIDILMHNSKDTIKNFLTEFTLEEN